MGKTKKKSIEKEREKYRKKKSKLDLEIAELNYAFMQKENELSILRHQLMQKEYMIRQLLEYAKLSEEDMKALFDKEEKKAKVLEALGEVRRIVGKLL